MQQHQIFQTASATRWQRAKWGSRVLLLCGIFLLIIIIVALRHVYNPSVPQLRRQGEAYKAILEPDKNLLMRDSRLLKQYRGFRQAIQVNKGSHIHYADSGATQQQMPCPVRAAFYVAWDAQSYFSLKDNISRMNMVLPEWFFIDPSGDTLTSNIDQRALAVIKASGVRTVPLLSNFSDSDFNGAAVHRIISNPAKSARLVNDIAVLLQRYHFQGINIDFEELQESGDEPMIAFMHALYQKLHPLGLLITQDIAALNKDYNVKELSRCTDYLFLMSYDQHNAQSDAGPVSEQKWIEATVADALSGGVPPTKLILCMAGYGYDWPKGSIGADVTYQEALTNAAEDSAIVSYDNDTYNLHYAYTDDDNIPHDVYFTDAATNFNTMRFAADNNLGGVSLWRLGSEDSRLWSFYLQDFSSNDITGYNLDTLRKVSPGNNVDYVGEGEILDVASTPKNGTISLEADTTDALISEEHYDQLPSSFVIRKYGKATKKLVLTFDDGPDADYTPRILDILGREHVPAAFFLVGRNAESNIPIVKRIYREGHEIGNHSFTHPNMAAISQDRAVLEMNATRLLIASITGHSTILFRAPYNADSEPETMEELTPVALARKYNYLTIGENIDPNDWEENVSADTIFNRIIQQEPNGNIILLHDAGGNREATVAVLPRIINYYRSKGYTFTTIADLLGRKKEDLMPAVPKDSGYYLVQGNYYIAMLGYGLQSLLFAVFIVCLVLASLRIIAMALLAVSERRRVKKKANYNTAIWPKVSIIVPAYNEEVNGVASLQHLLRSTYPNFDVVFVDDGSKDETYARIMAAFKDHPQVRIFTKPNGGKASALNYGIAQTDADYLLCIDADTHLLPDAVAQLMKHFTSENTGAVAGNVKVGNRRNLLTRWQHIEYVTSQNFDRLAFARINAITVIPGAIGAFRKEAIIAAGGFTSDTFAEDCDLTMRLLRTGYKVENEEAAIALTEAPETLRQFLKQRIRWTFGVMQAFWKNRDALLNRDYGSLGWIALPNILIFQIAIPLVTPFADLLMLIGLLTGNAGHILLYYGIFMLVDTAVALTAFLFEGERLSGLIWIIPQRLAYRWLMLYVLLKSLRRAVKGELQHWGVLKRTGNVLAPS